MEDTHTYVEKLHEKQMKDEKNKEKQREGNGNPSKRLPNKQH